MAKYEPKDIVTYYFVIKDTINGKVIHGWTDDKSIAKVYLEFHKCDNFKLKSITKRMDEMTKILEENWNDEIKIFNIITKNRTGKYKGEKVIDISIPATETEMMFIREESNAFISSMINYSYINDALPYLKKKYQQVLKDILLKDMIDIVIYSKRTKINQSIQFDELMILFKTFQDSFGI